VKLLYIALLTTTLAHSDANAGDAFPLDQPTFPQWDEQPPSYPRWEGASPFDSPYEPCAYCDADNPAGDLPLPEEYDRYMNEMNEMLEAF
jgi:hypothetical protein